MAIPIYEPAPVALIDGDRILSVELREAEDAAVEGGMVVAGGGRKGKRAEYRCAACGYGIVVYGHAPSCPMSDEPALAMGGHADAHPRVLLCESSVGELSVLRDSHS